MWAGRLIHVVSLCSCVMLTLGTYHYNTLGGQTLVRNPLLLHKLRKLFSSHYKPTYTSRYNLPYQMATPTYDDRFRTRQFGFPIQQIQFPYSRAAFQDRSFPYENYRYNRMGERPRGIYRNDRTGDRPREIYRNNRMGDRSREIYRNNRMDDRSREIYRNYRMDDSPYEMYRSGRWDIPYEFHRNNGMEDIPYRFNRYNGIDDSQRGIYRDDRMEWNPYRRTEYIRDRNPYIQMRYPNYSPGIYDPSFNMAGRNMAGIGPYVYPDRWFNNGMGQRNWLDGDRSVQVVNDNIQPARQVAQAVVVSDATGNIDTTGGVLNVNTANTNLVADVIAQAEAAVNPVSPVHEAAIIPEVHEKHKPIRIIQTNGVASAMHALGNGMSDSPMHVDIKPTARLNTLAIANLPVGVPEPTIDSNRMTSSGSITEIRRTAGPNTHVLGKEQLRGLRMDGNDPLATQTAVSVRGGLPGEVASTVRKLTIGRPEDMAWDSIQSDIRPPSGNEFFPMFERRFSRQFERSPGVAPGRFREFGEAGILGEERVASIGPLGETGSWVTGIRDGYTGDPGYVHRGRDHTLDERISCRFGGRGRDGVSGFWRCMLGR